MFNFRRLKKDDAFEGGFSVDTSYPELIQEDATEPNTPKKTTFREDIIDLLGILVSVLVAAIIIFTLFFRTATIDGDSMRNTLIGQNPIRGTIGDKVIITNLWYTPQYGDIVVISRNIENSIEGQNDSDAPIIKRVIAVGGQTVDIDFEKGVVYVDNKALEEDYISTPTVDKGDVEFPLYVPEGYIFVLGDNRGNSLDSRSTRIGEGGLVDTRYVLGHAIFRVYPFNRIGKIK